MTKEETEAPEDEGTCPTQHGSDLTDFRARRGCLLCKVRTSQREGGAPCQTMQEEEAGPTVRPCMVQPWYLSACTGPSAQLLQSLPPRRLGGPGRSTTTPEEGLNHGHAWSTYWMGDIQQPGLAPLIIAHRLAGVKNVCCLRFLLSCPGRHIQKDC